MYSDEEIQQAYQNYRDALERQRESAVQNLDQQRRNDYAAIMGTANTAGMMYSNFPARQKLQYEQQTYAPALTKIQTGYQTGLDTLRNNIIKYQNSIQSIKDSIDQLNSL